MIAQSARNGEEIKNVYLHTVVLMRNIHKKFQAKNYESRLTRADATNSRNVLEKWRKKTMNRRSREKESCDMQ